MPWEESQGGRQNLPQNNFLHGNFTPFFSKSFQIGPLLPLLFPKDSESLKILDIRLWEVGRAKRCLNGISKINRQTGRQTHGHTGRQTHGHTDGHFDL